MRASRVLICLFSAGWLVPAWGAAMLYLGHVQAFTSGPDAAVPFIELCVKAMDIAVVWLAAVIAFWAWRLTR